MTKKVFALAAGLLLATTAVHAEQYDELPKNEISVSYGAYPAYNLFETAGNFMFTWLLSPAVIAGETNDIELKIAAKKCFGVINVDYSHHFSPKFALGLNLSYSEAHGDVINIKNSDRNIANEKDNYYTIMPSAKWEWFRRQHVSMYSRLAAGVMIADGKYESKGNSDHKELNESYSKTKVYPMGQVSPFGIEGGVENIRAFLEVGFGQAGCFQFGARYRF